MAEIEGARGLPEEEGEILIDGKRVGPGGLDLKFEMTPEWVEERKRGTWHAFVPEYAHKDGKTYLRGQGRKAIYLEGDEEYICVTCNSLILQSTVFHSIHDGPFEGSGFGEVHQEPVPYCPKCESKPNPNGTPIRIPWG